MSNIREPYRITSTSTCPLLFEMLEDISHDAGARAGHQWHNISGEWEPWLPRLEAELATMSSEDRNTLAIGEEGEREKLVGSSVTRTVICALLHDFWEDHLPDGTTLRHGERG
jgi:hypothetical protein